MADEMSWRAFAGNVLDYAFILLDSENQVVDWNAGAEHLLGYKKDEIIGRSGGVFFTQEDRQASTPSDEIATALRDGRADNECWHVRKDGTRIRASSVLTPVRNNSSVLIGFAKVMRDVTEQVEAREQLKEAFRERTALLREVHHRVKNNLQM